MDPHSTSTGPAISLLSTAYRTEASVARMIGSVRAQTTADWELVVVDNGMSEEMARIVGAYTDDPRIVLVRQENRGMLGGVSAAAAVARGRYLSVLNSDDQILPGFCARLTSVLDARPELAAVACDAYFLAEPAGVRLTGTYLSRAGAPRPDERHRITLAELVDGVCPYYTAAVRREVWHEVGGYAPGEAIIADLDLWLRIVSAGYAIASVPDVLGVYTDLDESLSRGARSTELLERAREEALLRYAGGSTDPVVVTALDRALKRSHHRRALVQARVALMDGDFVEARRAAGRALRLRWGARTAAIAAGLAVAPRVLARAYPAVRRAARRGTPVTTPPPPIAPCVIRTEAAAVDIRHVAGDNRP